MRHAADLFAERGVAATTMRDIAERSGLTPGSLYHHFVSKNQVVAEIVTAYLDDLTGRFEDISKTVDDPKERFGAFVHAWFEAMDAHQAACEIFRTDAKVLHSMPELAELDAINERLRGYWLTTIEDGIARGSFRDDVDPWQFYRLTRNAIWFARVTTESHDMPHVPSHELAKSCLTVLLDGFAARTRRPRRR